nr:Mitochondrial fission regulator like [Ipomoea batatas]
MGNSCASSDHQIIRRCGRSVNSPSAGVAVVVKLDGKPEEFREAVRAGDILSEYQNCFLCSSEAMDVDSPVARLGDEEELQLGQLYFLLPMSKSHVPLSLHDMCDLAIKASAALNECKAMDPVREGKGRRRHVNKVSPGGSRVFSARALVAADASLGWMIKLLMLLKLIAQAKHVQYLRVMVYQQASVHYESMIEVISSN